MNLLAMVVRAFRILAGLLVALAAAPLAAAPVLAQAPASPAVSEQADQEARDLFGAGREAYTAARYAEALELFQRAYTLSRRPALLYNIGQAADRLRRDADAIAAFESYLRELPAAENRVEVETRLEVLRRVPAGQGSGSGEPVDRGGDDTLVIVLVGVGALVVGGAAVGLGFALYDPGAAAPPLGDVGAGGVVAALEARF